MLGWRQNWVKEQKWLVFGEYAVGDDEMDAWTGHVKAVTDPVI
jgi:hypothetical protein